MQNQAIYRQTFVTSATFTGTPSEETRKALLAAGFTFDGRSKQWYRSEVKSDIVTEEQVAIAIAA